MLSSNRFLCKVLDDPTDGKARPYSPLKGGLLSSLFHSLKNETISRYRDALWFKDELSFVAFAFTSHL